MYTVKSVLTVTQTDIILGRFPRISYLSITDANGITFLPDVVEWQEAAGKRRRNVKSSKRKNSKTVQIENRLNNDQKKPGDTETSRRRVLRPLFKVAKLILCDSISYISYRYPMS